MKEQFYRYRNEIAMIIKLSEIIKDSEENSILDYFSETTIEEIEQRNPFEALDDE